MAANSFAQGTCATASDVGTLDPCIANMTFSITGTNDAANNLASCAFDGDNATWVSFTLAPPATGITIDVADWGGCSGFLCATDITGALYSDGGAGDCSALTAVDDCIDFTGGLANGSSNGPFMYTGLTPGTYYLRLSEEDDQGGDIELQIHATPLPGDDVAMAIPLAAANGTYCNYTANGSDCAGANDANSCIGTVDNTIFYSFTVDASTPQPVTFGLENIICAGSMQMVIVSADCSASQGSGGNCSVNTGDVAPQLSETLPVGDYLLVVDGTAGDDCSWGLSSSLFVACPVVTTPVGGGEDICDGGTPVLDASALVIDDATLAVGSGTVSWWLDAAFTTAYAGTLAYPAAGDGCMAAVVPVFASIECVEDGSLISAGTVDVNVWPAINTTGLTGDGTCGPSFTSACANYTITNDYDANGAAPDFSAETAAGTVVFTITNTGAPTGCDVATVSAAYDCAATGCDLFITEFVYDVCNSSTLGDGSAGANGWGEYIILSNTSAADIDISNATIDDVVPPVSGGTVPAGTMVSAGGCVILAENTQAAWESEYGPVSATGCTFVTTTGTWPSLNNGGDMIGVTGACNNGSFGDLVGDGEAVVWNATTMAFEAGPIVSITPGCAPTAACEITDITIDTTTPVCNADGTYTVTLTTTAGPDASVSYTDANATIAGDDPATTANAATTFTYPIGTDANITVNDTEAACTFGPFAATSPAVDTGIDYMPLTGDCDNSPQITLPAGYTCAYEFLTGTFAGNTGTGGVAMYPAAVVNGNAGTVQFTVTTPCGLTETVAVNFICTSCEAIISTFPANPGN